MMFLQFITNIQNDGLKKWNFKVKSSSQEIIQKLNSAFESASGFAYNMDDEKNDSVVFNIRKRIKYSDQILHRNRIIVNGKLLKTNNKNETDIEVTFSQQYIMILTVISMVLSGLVLLALASKMSSGTLMYVLIGILIGVSIGLWFALKKKLENDIKKHKTLISQILEF